MKINTHACILALVATTISYSSLSQTNTTERIEVDGYDLIGRSVYRYQNQVYRGYGVFDIAKTNPNSVRFVERSQRQRIVGTALTVAGSITFVYAITQLFVRPQNIATPLAAGTVLGITGGFFSMDSRRNRQRAVHQFNLDAMERKYKQDTSGNKRPWNSLIMINHNEFSGFNYFTMGNEPLRRKKLIAMMRDNAEAKPFAAIVEKNTKTAAITGTIAVAGFVTLRLLQNASTEEIPRSRAGTAAVVGAISVGCTIAALITDRAANRAETNGVRILNGDSPIPFNRNLKNPARQNISLLLGTGNYGLGLVAKW